MMKRTLLLVLALLLSCFSSAHAYFPFTSLAGASGLTRIPDANVLPYKNWDFAVDYGALYANNGNQQQPAFYYKANLGSFHNFEMGLVGGLDSAGQQLRDGVYINMKYAPSIGDGSDPLLLAIGVENLASKTQTGVYMVATKPLAQGPSLSFGFLADFPGNKFRPLGMLGIDIPIGTLSLLADMFAGENLSQFNAGLRYRVIPTFAFEARAINILGDNQTPAQNLKDPKQLLIGFSWINPF